jgi:uncharacterized membrane protein YfbV (UPF0208 family)
MKKIEAIAIQAKRSRIRCTFLLIDGIWWLGCCRFPLRSRLCSWLYVICQVLVWNLKVLWSLESCWMV